MDTDREPRQERSRATRARLLEAAVACLAERGVPGTTVGAVAERAGVSRGAAQHHFQTREDLFVAAFDSMADGLIAGLRRLMGELPEGPGRVEAMVMLLFDVFSGTEFQAALQLWTGAASDPDLHPRVVPLEQRVGREAHRTAVEVLGVDESVPGVRETVQATLDLARGLGLANLLTDDTARRHRIACQWAAMLERELGPHRVG